MGKKYVLLDDFDGKELPDDTAPVRLSLGRTTYNLYLSEDNHGKLLKALDPFIADAETESTRSTAQTGRQGTASNSAEKEKLRKVREWAIATGFEYTNSAGETKKLGDRGRIPDSVVEAYDKEN